MKKILKLFLFALLIFTTLSSTKSMQKSKIFDCSYNGIKLHGKVQFVDAFPDIKIQIVKSFPDLNVKLVSAFPDNCGEWEVVESFPDFKVKIVESFPDLKIQYVESSPGQP